MLPSGNALFVFEAAARSGSFTAAAAELNVTQPAVSRMLARFEQYLGVRLFDRTAAGATLTEEGDLLFRRVLEGFRSIETGLREIEKRRSGDRPSRGAPPRSAGRCPHVVSCGTHVLQPQGPGARGKSTSKDR